MVNLEEEDYEGDIYKIVGNGYAACIITEFLRCLATLHSGYVSRDDICSWNMTFAWINKLFLKLKIESFCPVRMQTTWAFCSRLFKYDCATTVGFLAILLLDATQKLCVGTARSLDTMLAIAPMIQSAIHVVRWGTLLASAVTLIFQFRMQVSAIIDIGQATLLLTVEIRSLQQLPENCCGQHGHHSRGLHVHYHKCSSAPMYHRGPWIY
ncbi:hypothetical protein NC652_026514 [Populus alba x Populus x berolinensis]|nr:hypothetical protein NC652_026514 [Populus alba x Populus x berolinensis]